MIENVYCSQNSAVVSQCPVQSHFKSMSVFINPRGKHDFFLNGMWTLSHLAQSSSKDCRVHFYWSWEEGS